MHACMPSGVAVRVVTGRCLSARLQVKSNVAIDTYDDHRMAMAFSLTACGGVPVIINDPSCTKKTFPTYFTVFEGVAKH